MSIFTRSEVKSFTNYVRIFQRATCSEDLHHGTDKPIPRRSCEVSSITSISSIALFQQTPVTSIAINDKSVKGVQTTRGYVKSTAVLLATGAWTSRLLAKAGIALPTHAGVATMAATRPVAPLSESTMWEVGQRGLRQDASGRIVFGLGGYVDVDVRWEDVRRAISTLPTFWANRHAVNIRIGRTLLQDMSDVWRGRHLRPFRWAEIPHNESFVGAGLARLAHMIPSLAPDLALDAVWTGLIDTTQDFLPAVGTAGVEGLVFVAGLSGHGFGTGSCLGRGGHSDADGRAD